MPDRRAVFQLGLLLLAVPVQYVISRYYSTSQAERSQTLRKIFNGAIQLKDEYLSWQSWERWCMLMVQQLQKYTSSSRSRHSTGTSTGTEDGSQDTQGESPAVEVMTYRDPNGYFAASTEPRTVRPPHVKFRIGQVVKHKKWGYRGVIIGWDLNARAPESWLKQNHAPDKKHWSSQPNYAILVDTRDRMTPQMTYVPQENIHTLVNVQVIHPLLDSYFEGFDGAQYLPRPSLKHVYPLD